MMPDTDLLGLPEDYDEQQHMSKGFLCPGRRLWEGLF
jgi:hypothetical protein